ncbi:hypothetical protein IG631_23983 [Alternaria alternata]|nr:hypothetical protein IG631_23983 [Alternaria alternata]
MEATIKLTRFVVQYNRQDNFSEQILDIAIVGAVMAINARTNIFYRVPPRRLPDGDTKILQPVS